MSFKLKQERSSLVNNVPDLISWIRRAKVEGLRDNNEKRRGWGSKWVVELGRLEG